MQRVFKQVAIHRETLTTGEKVYVARDLDMPGLMAHGSSPDAAADSLDEARALRNELAHQPDNTSRGGGGATLVNVPFERSGATIAHPYSRKET